MIVVITIIMIVRIPIITYVCVYVYIYIYIYHVLARLRGLQAALGHLAERAERRGSPPFGP